MLLFYIFATTLHLMKNFIANIDFWGCTTSTLCAFHCALLPLLISLGMINSHSWIANPMVEISVFILAFTFVYLSIIRHYLDTRDNTIAFYLACIGLILLALHHVFIIYSTLIVVIGGFCLALAHVANIFYSSHSFSK